MAIDAGVDFVQGYYFRRPSILLEEISTRAADIDRLLSEYKSQSLVTSDPTHQLIHYFSDDFREAIARLNEGVGMQQACLRLLEHPAVSRCYLVDDKGVQIEDTLISETTARSLDPRFRPLESTTSADWYRQQYLRQALARPENLQATTPYLCITGAYMCVTLSLGYYYRGELRVLCCDLIANSTRGISQSG